MLATSNLAQAFDEWVAQPERLQEHWELINGQKIYKMPSHPKSSAIGATIASFIVVYVRQHKLGVVTDAQGGYQVLNDRYIPDVGFLRAEKKDSPIISDYYAVAPNLAVEVISPTDSMKQLLNKVSNYLAAGTVVWLIDPDDETLTVYAPAQPAKIFGKNSQFVSEGVLEGFILEMSALFE